ncbi:phage regulatory CII family protein [Pseudomonas japonica]|uniref:phage regulatory CII family protein n=1 Tax=Pseudomonas japonica TaxID=256466 RepID=UPI003A840E36
MSRIDTLPDDGPVLSLRHALYRAGRGYKGGITTLAFDLGMDLDALQKKLKHDEERRWLTPDELEEVLQWTKDKRILDALGRAPGVVWYRPQPVPATNEQLKAVGQLLEEAAKFVSSMHEGAADEIWELHEVQKLEACGADVIRQVLAVMAGARQAMEERTHG